MNLVEWLQRLMTNFGAGWVMWLLIVLSVLSVAIMLERGWFYWSLRDDLGTLASQLRDFLRNNDIDGARKRLEKSPSAEAAVVMAGLLEADRGAKSADEAMKGAAALQRMKLEKRLAFLGTLGNNAYSTSSRTSRVMSRMVSSPRRRYCSAPNCSTAVPRNRSFGKRSTSKKSAERR